MYLAAAASGSRANPVLSPQHEMNAKPAAPTPDFDLLRAPADDGGVVIVPSLAGIASIADRNRSMRNATPIRLLDEAVRAEPSGPTVIATGHQPEFMHPGVWAKNVAAVRVAESLGGRVEFFVVDSDVAADAMLRWPQEREGRLVAAGQGLPGVRSGRSFEQLDALSRDEWRSWLGEVPRGYREDSQRVFGDFETAFARSPNADSYVNRWLAGISSIDRRLRVTSPHATRVSELETGWYGSSWTRFVAHLLLNAREFAAAYNGALSAYRSARRIRGRRHPIPDLVVESDSCESPFWLTGKLESRKRMFVRRHATGHLELSAGGGPGVTIGRDELRRKPEAWRQALSQRGELRPRALALTMFARLFACDCFVHGLGGAKYDQVTDGIIREFFGVTPPAYSCVTATLRLDLRRTDVTIERLRSLRREVRDRRFNPQRYLIGDAPSALVDERIAAITDSDELRRSAAFDRDRRRQTFERIWRANSALSEYVAPGPDAERMAQLGIQLAENVVANDREWFVGLHPIGRLERLRDAIHGTSRAAR